MLIPITIPQPGSSSETLTSLPPQLAQFGTDELVLVELQGTLEPEGDSRGQVVGRLSVDTAAKKSTLRIGHHLLEGKLVNLAKPLAVLRRPPNRNNSQQQPEGDCGMDVDQDGDGDGDGHEGQGNGQGAEAAQWEVRAVVRRKMVFSKRPMPIVEKPALSSVDLKKVKKG